ncbi:hypothetical protein LEP1GSC103_3456 [Leptospira borgpetersenii serovar Javanica str. UI 09931]|uniref:Uncharacterized protein n=1 Tax=Leptospira borgpetersenii serovar Javanica str. UI 09931 TaxID=1049767 RepID=A0AAV3JFP5_LEPBO|nr:hypothetical protein LEP1GSC101_3596 [Leptospira borgpetersenii str. UI 09149]EMN60134.1 hypothetical protein LEP1GSC090_3417 [Leptospira borgpetersenii serovar Javanica str. MK146]EPG59511.1 hypothetical protein LEP1GSC103_3456 [Leptospira borgpetersenii serovar Javanica str. UI 09931]
MLSEKKKKRNRRNRFPDPEKISDRFNPNKSAHKPFPAF